MSEAGDGPGMFSGLEEVVHPFSHRDDMCSVDSVSGEHADRLNVDDLDDDEVFLAPRRDFSPSGMARDEGADADIDSPFAALENKTVSELMSPVRRSEGDPERSQHVLEAKAPAPVPAPEPVVPLRPLRKEAPPSLPPAPPPIAAPPLTPASLTPLDASLPSSPSLTRPRLVQPTLEQPAIVWPKALPPGPRRRPIADIGNEVPPSVSAPSSDHPITQEMPASPAPAFRLPIRDHDALPMRRRIDALQPTTDPVPAGPPPPGRLRLAIDAMAEAGSAFRRGFGTAWARYSKDCLALQNRLSELAGWALVQARSFASYSEATLVRLGHESVQGARIGGVYAWKVTKAAARHASILAKTAHSVANQGLVHAAAFIRQILAVATKAFANLRVLPERWLAARAERRREAAEAAKAAKAAKVAEAIETLNAEAGVTSTPPKASYDPLPASKVLVHRSKQTDQVFLEKLMQNQRPSASSTESSECAGALGSSVAAKPAMVSPATRSQGEKAAVTPPTEEAPLAEPKSRLFSRLGPERLSLAGLAAASIALLIAAFALSPTTGPASAALTFPIPEKPVSGAIPPTGADTLSETAGTVAIGEVPPLPELDDPIAEMLAYVGEGASLPPAVSNGNPVLARAGSIEGLSQFVRAAEIVGLKELLEPGEAYTIFVPNDAAFAKLAAGEVDNLLEPTGHERLLTLLSHHVLPGRLGFDELQGDVHEYTSLAGGLVSIDATEVARVGGASIVEADLQADNGVLHVIDQILPITGP